MQILVSAIAPGIIRVTLKTWTGWMCACVCTYNFNIECYYLHYVTNPTIAFTFKNNQFIWLHWLLVTACNLQASLRYAGSYGMRTLSFGLWDLVSWPGIESGLSALGGQSLSHWTTREILPPLLFILSVWCLQSFGLVTSVNLVNSNPLMI